MFLAPHPRALWLSIPLQAGGDYLLGKGRIRAQPPEPEGIRTSGGRGGKETSAGLGPFSIRAPISAQTSGGQRLEQTAASRGWAGPPFRARHHCSSTSCYTRMRQVRGPSRIRQVSANRTSRRRWEFRTDTSGALFPGGEPG